MAGDLEILRCQLVDARRTTFDVVNGVASSAVEVMVMAAGCFGGSPTIGLTGERPSGYYCECVCIICLVQTVRKTWSGVQDLVPYWEILGTTPGLQIPQEREKAGRIPS